MQQVFAYQALPSLLHFLDRSELSGMPLSMELPRLTSSCKIELNEF